MSHRSIKSNILNPKSDYPTARRSSASNSRPVSVIEKFDGHRRHISALPLDLSQINAPKSNHISMMANRIETEVEEDEIYLKHFFRNKMKGAMNHSLQYGHDRKEMNETAYCRKMKNAYDDRG